jgi:phage-related holin
MKEWLNTILLAITAFVSPVQAMLITIVVLVFSDMITGLLRAKKQQQPINSYSLRKTVPKLLAYLAMVLIGNLVEIHLLNHAIPLTNLCASVVGLVEFKSILENLEIVTGKPVFKTILDKIQSQNNKIK